MGHPRNHRPIYIYIYSYLCKHLFNNICMYVVCRYVCINECMYLYMYVCMGQWFFGCPVYQSGPGKDGFWIDISMASQSSFSRSLPAAIRSRNKLRCSACLIYTCMGAEASTLIGCCSWPIRVRLRVTGPSGSAVGVWSSV